MTYTDWEGHGTDPPNHSVDDDPHFVDPIQGDYRLDQQQTGLVDLALDANVPADDYDADGDGNLSELTPDRDLLLRDVDAVPGGEAVDMGCYEVQLMLPGQATDPDPEDGAENVPITTNLSWIPGAGAVVHDVYFGLTYPPPLVVADHGYAYYIPPTDLLNDTVYHWRIDEVNAAGTTTGQEWTFTTIVAAPGQATLVAPPDGAVDVPVTGALLIWTAGVRATSHDVYFSTSPDPSDGYQGNQPGTTFALPPLATGTPYYWRIDEVNVGGTTTGTVWGFTTIVALPAQAHTPLPFDGATDVAIDADLNWTAGERAETHDVYFGDDSGALVFMGNQAGTMYTPTGLVPCHPYYWRIDERNAAGSTEGVLWSFTTIVPLPHPADDPQPGHGATGVDVNENLSWTSYDCTTSHDVYFGEFLGGPDPPPLVAQGHQNTNYPLDTLEAGTWYHWRIDEVNETGTAEGMIWVFETFIAPAEQAHTPDPPDGATDVDAEATVLTWIAGDRTATHHVYFGTNSNPTEYQGSQDVGDIDFNPGPLESEETYYWRIDEENAAGTTTGNVWSFTVEMVCPKIIYAALDAPAGGDGTTWSTAYRYLQDALWAADAYLDNPPPVACSNVQVWVKGFSAAKKGYQPNLCDTPGVCSGGRAATFYLRSHVGIYGGFAGDERSWEFGAHSADLYITILDGDIDAVGQNDSYHVVTAATTVDGTAVLSGVRVTGGWADGTDAADKRGGGLYNEGSPRIENSIFAVNGATDVGAAIYNEAATPVIRDCTFDANGKGPTRSGGAIYNQSSSPAITRCRFSGNQAQFGGAIYNDANSHPLVEWCTFTKNVAVADGGGIFTGGELVSGYVTVRHCVFEKNRADIDDNGAGNGGAVYDGPSDPVIAGNDQSEYTNCLFRLNGADKGGAIYHVGLGDINVSTFVFNYADRTNRKGGGLYVAGSTSNPDVDNCIFWGNRSGGSPQQDQIYLDGTAEVSVDYSDVQSGWAGQGNIEQDPMFVNSSDQRLLLGSPCIDAGANSEVPNGIEFDLDGKIREVDGDCDATVTVDMGSYEYQRDCP